MFKKFIKILLFYILGASVFLFKEYMVNASTIVSSSGKEYIIGDNLFATPLDEKLNSITNFITEPIYGKYHSNKETIIGIDNLLHVENSLIYPYSTSAFVESYFPNQSHSSRGSANFIAKNVLITAGHNVFNWLSGGVRANEIYVSPAINNSNAPFGKFKVKDYFYMSEYGKFNKFEYDIAVLILEEDLGNILGTLGLPQNKSNRVGLRVTNVGYPYRSADYDSTTNTVDIKMYKESGRILRDDDKLLYYKFDTLGGSSGSAVFDSNYRIVGVHVAGDSSTPENISVKLNEKTLKFIYSIIANDINDGWKKIEDKWYYYVSGNYQTGWYQLDNQWYYFNSEGHLLTGWQQINNHWYYFDEIGEMVTNWMFINDKWYFFSDNGDMKTGWQQINGKWYYLDDINGDMKTGWIELKDKWYYLNNLGAMVTGTHTINGKTYKFNSSGEWIK